MPTWEILDYINDQGGSPFEVWIDAQPVTAQAAISARLLGMESLENWPPKWVTKLSDWNGLLELRIPQGGVQYRPLAVYRPGRQLVLLCGAIEKGDVIPRRLLDTADRRRKHLEREPAHVKPHEF